MNKRALVGSIASLLVACGGDAGDSGERANSDDGGAEQISNGNGGAEQASNGDGSEQADDGGVGSNTNDGSSGSDDFGPRPDNSGVAKDTRVTALTDDDAKKFCRWLEELDTSLNVTDEQDCTLEAAWDDALTTEACVAQRDACLAEIEPDQPGVDDCADVTADDIDVPSGCSDVTVGQVESCLVDLADVYEAAAVGATCEALDSIADPTSPETCDDGEVIRCVPDV